MQGGSTSQLRENPERDRASLLRELNAREREVPAPVRDDVRSLGKKIIDEMPTPHALNISCAEDGSVLFTLFGKNDREAELWVGEKSGHVAYVVSERGGAPLEGSLPIREYQRVARWLRGDSDQV